MQLLLTFYNDGRDSGGFEKGIEDALARILVSPSFLFRIEQDPAESGAANARIASAISSWRRGCRSSCGAAFPTTSCSSSPSAAS